MKIQFTRLKEIIFFSCISFFSFNIHAQTARLQVVHNAADPSLNFVDVYVNNVLTIDNFAFRTATPFQDVPAGVNVVVSVAPSASSSSAEAFYTNTYNFPVSSKNILVASGVTGAGFQANPNARPIAFEIFHHNAGKEAANDPATIELNSLHGTTDLPVIDVFAGVIKIANNLGYGDFSGYDPTTPASNTYQVTSYDNLIIYGNFEGDFSAHVGKTAVLFTSGFITPADDNNGPAFGLFAAVSDGTIITLTNTGIAGISSKTNSFSNITAYPFPATGNLTLEVVSEKPGEATLELVDMMGRSIANIQQHTLAAGENTIPLNLSHLSPGQYIIKIVSAGYTGTARCLLQK